MRQSTGWFRGRGLAANEEKHGYRCKANRDCTRMACNPARAYGIWNCGVHESGFLECILVHVLRGDFRVMQPLAGQAMSALPPTYFITA